MDICIEIPLVFSICIRNRITNYQANNRYPTMFEFMNNLYKYILTLIFCDCANVSEDQYPPNFLPNALSISGRI